MTGSNVTFKNCKSCLNFNLNFSLSLERKKSDPPLLIPSSLNLLPFSLDLCKSPKPKPKLDLKPKLSTNYFSPEIRKKNYSPTRKATYGAVSEMPFRFPLLNGKMKKLTFDFQTRSVSPQKVKSGLPSKGGGGGKANF